MIYNGTSHPIYILDKKQLIHFRNDEFSIKDDVEEVNIVKTIDLDLELNIHTTNSINPHIYTHDDIDIYMPDTYRIANIDFVQNFKQYDKIIVSSIYVNKILQYYIHNYNLLQQNYEYLNKLYVVHGTVRKCGKIIGCVGLKKVFHSRNLETIYNLFNTDLDSVDILELIMALMDFKARSNDDVYMNTEYVQFVIDYLNKKGINFNI